MTGPRRLAILASLATAILLVFAGSIWIPEALLLRSVEGVWVSEPNSDGETSATNDGNAPPLTVETWIIDGKTVSASAAYYENGKTKTAHWRGEYSIVAVDARNHRLVVDILGTRTTFAVSDTAGRPLTLVSQTQVASNLEWTFHRQR